MRINLIRSESGICFAGNHAMYVCICNGLTDKDFTRAAEAGVRTVGEAFGFLGERPQCGKCLSCAREVLAAARLEMAQRSIQEAAE